MLHQMCNKVVGVTKYKSNVHKIIKMPLKFSNSLLNFPKSTTALHYKKINPNKHRNCDNKLNLVQNTLSSVEMSIKSSANVTHRLFLMFVTFSSLSMAQQHAQQSCQIVFLHLGFRIWISP